MNKEQIYFTIIIRDTTSNILIDSLLAQSFTDWECFIIGQNSDIIQEHTNKDKRFTIVNDPLLSTEEKINNIIKKSNGKYIMILNSFDYFIPFALSIFTQMTYATESEVISFETVFTKHIKELPAKEYTCIYRYLVRRKTILEYVFNDLSGFCFRKDFLQNTNFVFPEDLFILKTLLSTPALCRTKFVGVLHTEKVPSFASVEYKKIVDVYIENKDNFDKKFWKNYFQVLVPKILQDTIYQHDTNTLIYCCKKINMKMIPWKYKPIALLFKFRKIKNNGTIEWQ